MFLNCGVGEDSWESLGLQGDPTSPSWRRSVLGVHWKDRCWSWNSNPLATWCKELTHLKRPCCWKDWGQEEKGKTEVEIVGWRHQQDGHGFGWITGVGDGQEVLACYSSWGRKESDTTEQLNWTESLSRFYLGFRCEARIHSFSRWLPNHPHYYTHYLLLKSSIPGDITSRFSSCID